MARKVKSSVFDDPAAFRQQVRLASVQVLGLAPAELEMALAYELEPTSGISAAAAEVEYRPVADPDATVRVFDVAVRARRGKAVASDPFARFVWPAVVLGSLLLLTVGVDFYLLRSRCAALEKERAVRQPLDARLKAVQAEARSKRDEAVRLRAAREAAVRAQEEAARYRVAGAEALKALSAACGKTAALASLTAPDDYALEVSGTAVSAKAAADAMATLTKNGAAVGWTFRPDTIRTSAHGTTASFTGGLRRD